MKSKLERFIAKRVLIFFLLLAIVVLVLMKEKWFVLCGLAIGGTFSVFKFSSYALVFKRIISSGSQDVQPKHAVRSSILIFIINQIILLPLLFITLKIGIWLFAGIVAGILLVPCVIMINCITEAFHITHNNFE